MTEAIAIAIIGSSAFTVCVNALVESVKTMFGNKSSTTKAVNFSFMIAIQMYGEKLVDKGTVDPEEIKQFSEMYQLYKKRGGNGYVDRLKAEVEKLPLRRMGA